MPQGEQDHPTVTPVRRRRRRRGRRIVGWVAGFVVVVVAAGAVAQWRYGVVADLADDLGLPGSSPTVPAAIPPPAGLDLPAQPVARPVAAVADPRPLDRAAVRRALAPYVGAKPLRHNLDLVVATGDGRIVYRRGSGTVTPASTMKLLTTTAALATLGPQKRFTTSVSRVAGTNRIVLVGGGDPFLASTPAKARGLYPPRATLSSLATATAASLVHRGLTRVRLGYDASLFTGPSVDPHWPSTYLSEDVVPPISALWVDEGRDPGRGYTSAPAASAAQLFAQQLHAAGIDVTGQARAVTAPHGARRVAAVHSAPLGEIVERTLAVSDNNAAEVLLRHIGLVRAGHGSFAAGTTGVRAVLRGLGVPLAGLTMYDGSGLSRDDRVDPRTIIGVLAAASATDHPRLRDVVTGLPVAGFSGSLTSRYDDVPAAGRGRVRAKTGTLTGVSGLAGTAVDLTGTPMLFAAMADHIAVPDTLAARAALDRITAALGACRCGSTP